MNLRNQAFIEEYLNNGGNATTAYLTVYQDVTYGTAKTEGNKLITRPDVQLEIAAKRAVLAQKNLITRQQMIEDLNSSAEEAKQAGQYAAYAKMREMIIKIYGYYAPDKVQVSNLNLELKFPDMNIDIPEVKSFEDITEEDEEQT